MGQPQITTGIPGSRYGTAAAAGETGDRRPAGGGAELPRHRPSGRPDSEPCSGTMPE